MLPLSVLLGFGCGIGTHDRRTLRLALWVGVAASVLFGIVVALATEPAHGFGGVALAFVNHVVGFVLGSGVRGGAELLARGARRITRA